MSLADLGFNYGEPWQANFDPAVLGQDLRAMGFKQITDLGQDDINARYFAGRADGLRVGSIYRLLSAWV